MTYYDSKYLTPIQLRVRQEIDRICRICAEEYNIAVDDMKVKTRKRTIVEPRQIAMHLAYKTYKNIPGCTQKFMASVIGEKDHATLVHSSKMVVNFSKNDKNYRYRLAAIESKVYRTINLLPELKARADNENHKELEELRIRLQSEIRDKVKEEEKKEKPTVDQYKEMLKVIKSNYGREYHKLKLDNAQNPEHSGIKNKFEIIKARIRREFLYHQIEKFLKEIEQIDTHILCDTNRKGAYTEDQKRELMSVPTPFFTMQQKVY